MLRGSAIGVAVLFAASMMPCGATAADVPTVDLFEWTPPSIGSVGDDPVGKLIKYG
jgi:hypothetical protein